MSSFRLLVLDIDGTTLTQDRRLRRADAWAVRALQDEGVHVALATGRLYSGTAPLAHRLHVRAPVACMNGSEMAHPTNGARTLQRTLPEDLLSELRDRLRARGADPFLFGSGALHLCGRSTPLMRYLESWSETFSWYDDIYEGEAWSGRDPLLAVAASGEADALAQARDELAPLLPEHVEAITFTGGKGRNVLMIRDGREDKGRALRTIAAELGVTAEESIAVGDWLNDLPMLQVAGRSFAMGQAPPPVKEAATDVLEATSEHGGAIAEVARKVWGIQLPDTAWEDERRFARAG